MKKVSMTTTNKHIFSQDIDKKIRTILFQEDPPSLLIPIFDTGMLSMISCLSFDKPVPTQVSSNG
jgi:hypothetical protein